MRFEHQYLGLIPWSKFCIWDPCTLDSSDYIDVKILAKFSKSKIPLLFMLEGFVHTIKLWSTGQFAPLILNPRSEWDWCGIYCNQCDNQILILTLFLFCQFCVTAVLDWELSTLGDPILDLAYCCMPYHWPKELDFASTFSLGMVKLLSSHHCPVIG